jgi:hypothetical protein
MSQSQVNLYNRTSYAALTLQLANRENCWDTLLRIFGRDHLQYRCEQFCAFEAIAPYYPDSRAHSAWIIVTLKGNNPYEGYNFLSTGSLVRVVDYSCQNDPKFPEIAYAFGSLEKFLWNEPGSIKEPGYISLDHEHHLIAIPSTLISQTDKETLVVRNGTIGQRIDAEKMKWHHHCVILMLELVDTRESLKRESLRGHR